MTQHSASTQTGWTGIGSFSGTHIDQALRVAFEHAPELPFLPELPARGPGADIIGRTAGLLVDLPVDLVPAGWRLVSRPGRDVQRVADMWERDLDALADFAADHDGQFKTQLSGMWTLAARLVLPGGSPLLADSVATQDVFASLLEGVRTHIAELRRRLPKATLVLQLDEPSLPVVLAGGLPTESGLSHLRPVEAVEVRRALGRLIAGVAPVPVVVRCASKRTPCGLIASAGAAGVSVNLDDIDLESPDTIDPLAAAVDGGVALWLGTAPSRGETTDLSDPTVRLTQVQTLWSRLGQRPSAVVLTPMGGLAEATIGYASAALDHCRTLAHRLDVER